MITIQEVKKIAKLARLNLNDKEGEAYAQTLNNILEHMNELEAVNTADVAPLSHPFDFINHTRPDEPKQAIAKEEMLSNAPNVEDDCFKVPKILDH